jgi:endo-1,4-beta-xylanase
MYPVAWAINADALADEFSMSSVYLQRLFRQAFKQPFGQKLVYTNDFLVGNIMNERYMGGYYFNMIKNHFNVITPEDGLKSFSQTSNRGGTYNCTCADQVVNQALESGMPVHGYVLVWHGWTPEWMTKGTRTEAENNLKNYITDVLAHYHGGIHFWDVVNEVMRDELFTADTARSWKRYLRTDTSWYSALGADYIGGI